MTHKYTTHVYDSSGNNVTGKFSPDAFTVSSLSTNDKQGTLNTEKTVHFSPEVNTFPLVSLDPTKLRSSIFQDPTTIWKYNRYSLANIMKINGKQFLYKNGTLASVWPQDLVIDEDGNTYVTCNIGSITQVAQNGGPSRSVISGITTEYQNVTPIIKFSPSGVILGVEYVLGVVHAGHICFYKDINGKDTIAFSVYSEGIGTKNESTLPSGWDSSWTPYYRPSDTSFVSFECIKTSGLFTSVTRNDDDIFIPSHMNTGNGKKLTMLADEVETFGANKHVINQSYTYDDVGKNILLGVSITGITQTGISYLAQSVFHFNPDSSNVSMYNKPSNIISNGNSSWGSRTLQSFYLRGAHKYLTYGSIDTGEKGAGLSVLNITKPTANGQSVISQKDYNLDTNWKELEGVYVTKDETSLYAIELYNLTDYQEIRLNKYPIQNLY